MEKKEVLEKVQSKKALIGEMEKTKIDFSGRFGKNGWYNKTNYHFDWKESV